MPLYKQKTISREEETQERILKAAQKLYARRGYGGTTNRELAQAAGVAEGTLYRHNAIKKAILIEVATRGWTEILTDLLTELSEMASYKAVAQVMRKRMLSLNANTDMLRVCFMEAQFHPELRDRIQAEVIDKMTDVDEAFFQTAMARGVYRKMNPKVDARIFLGMFTVSGFSQTTMSETGSSPNDMKEMAETLADIFLNGVLEPQT